MLNPTVKIVFTDLITSKSLEFDFANEIEIKKSRSVLTNTCTIKFPRKMVVLDGDINTILKRGSRVTVMLGYGTDMHLEFTGYIARIGAKMPLEISCEDEMWKLKQNSFSKAWKKVSLEEVVKYVYPGEARIKDIDLGSFVIKKQSTALVFDKLKGYGVQCFFDSEGVLVAEFTSAARKEPNRVNYDFNKNVIENNLEFVTPDDLKVMVKGISKLPDGKKIEEEFGDKDGAIRSMNHVNMDRKALKEVVEEDYKKLKKGGYKKNFKTFGIPYAEPGDIAIMHDKKYPERQGSYLIGEVHISSGTSGYRRDITLETKLA